MASALRSVALFSLASALFLGLGIPACSQQGEGERCDKTKAGNNDCEAGLTCRDSQQLLDKSTDRCCSDASSDPRCRLSNEGSSSGGKGGGTSVPEGGKPAGGDAGDEGGTAPAAGMSSNGGTPSATPEGGSSNGGAPVMTDGGMPAAGNTQQPTAGQGGAD